ncbi:hypothetical protein ACLQ2P_41700 [Actinomadura citrea]|uniref:hypothetical protein n=1 Tax=Actinomadura citrea TaxID=46158 RepID=UPI003CE56FEF
MRGRGGVVRQVVIAALRAVPAVIRHMVGAPVRTCRPGPHGPRLQLAGAWARHLLADCLGRHITPATVDIRPRPWVAALTRVQEDDLDG